MSPRLPSTALLAVALIAPSAATAYERTEVPQNGICLHLPDREVAWAAASPLGSSLAEEQALGAIRLSFAVWQTESCSDLAFVEGPRVGPEIGFDRDGQEVTTVVFRDRRCVDAVPAGDPCWRDESCANAYDCWDGDDRQIALTTTTFSTCDGEMKDSDIELNAAGFRFTVVDGPPCTSSGQDGCVDTDLENTLVHEIGHVIGLDHSPVRDATMYASAPAGETSKRDLGDDDRAALCAIYPAGEATATCGPAPQCAVPNGSGAGCAAFPGIPAAPGLLAALAWLVARRRKGSA
jgi:uncharacterized protein (TIGR03382 family)